MKGGGGRLNLVARAFSVFKMAAREDPGKHRIT